MTKKQSPQPTRTPVNSLRHLVIFIGVVLVSITLIASSIYVWHQKQIRDDRARFAAAEVEIKDLSQRIIAATGQPLKQEFSKTCSRPNLKYETGRLSCSVESDFAYNSSNAQRANSLDDIITDILNKNWTTLKHSNQRSFLEIDSTNYLKNSYQQVQVQYFNFQKMSCSMNSYYYLSQTPPFAGLDFNYTSPTALYVTINCTAPAPVDFFS